MWGGGNSETLEAFQQDKNSIFQTSCYHQFVDGCNFLSSPLKAMVLKDASWATVHIDLFVQKDRRGKKSDPLPLQGDGIFNV